MILSRSKKFIFFHTPKVAGSSLNAALRKYGNIPSSRLYNYLLDYIGRSNLLGVYSRHISPLQLSREISSKKFNSYRKIAFVRNPFDWHVSQYHFHKQNDFAVFHEIFSQLSFDDYLLWANDNVRLSKSNQYEFLSDEKGTLLVDFVGKIENINDSFEELKGLIGIDAVLSHRNRSKRAESYRQYYSEEGKKIVLKMNEKDLNYFGYEF